MEELLRTNDITVIAYANAILTGSGIDVFELDVNTSVLEGSIGILPRRLMVADAEYDDACDILIEAGVHADELS